MGNNMRLPLPPVLVQSIDRDGQSTDSAGQFALTSLLSEAVDAARITEKQAARDMGYDPSYWSRIKAGQKQAHLDRIALLPELVQQEFVKRWARQLRMTVRDDNTHKQKVAALLVAAAQVLEEIA